jgi:hypothetical protein
MPSLRAMQRVMIGRPIEVPTAVLDRISGVRAGTRSMEDTSTRRASRRHGVLMPPTKPGRPRAPPNARALERPFRAAPPNRNPLAANPAHLDCVPYRQAASSELPVCSYGLPADSRFDARRWPSGSFCPSRTGLAEGIEADADGRSEERWRCGRRWRTARCRRSVRTTRCRGRVIASGMERGPPADALRAARQFAVAVENPGAFRRFRVRPAALGR